MFKRKLKKVEIIILIGFINCAIAYLGMWLWFKAPDRDFFLPEDYTGWIKIKYSVPHAPALPEIDGVQQIIIPDSGYLETSTALNVGWRKDRFFWREGDKAEIEPFFTEGEESYRYVSDHQSYSVFHENIIKSLTPGTDTLLADETEIELDLTNRLNYQPGKKSLEYFYLSAEPRKLAFIPPPLVDSEALKSVEDRMVRTK
ncbi:MAG: hypothetical protein AAFV78_04665 [Bacteroidota bacterium]